MHREIQIKKIPIVTKHWWPKTRNERFVWENEQYLYRFLPLVHNHVRFIQDEWNGYMERSYRNTMHDSKRVCLKEVIIILE